ncbi:kinase-like protein [Xylariaceae sp. FL0804]|nr:kinase-like protein [Xylariaceae sp. FL0804]
MDSLPQPRPQLVTDNPPLIPSVPSRTANSTPISSPGLFSPSNPRPNNLPPQSASDASTPNAVASSPYLHPLQTHRVRETHKALVDLNLMTGRKIINQYEVIEELGRGVHGKVKLARNLETNDNVAIKIIPRFSKKRRLGKVTASPQDKTKREIAILKKIRHPNVVALLEIIDDPELKKIYMVLEHVELGEVIWRKKGLPTICNIERKRIEREMRGEPGTDEEERYYQLLERRQALTELKRAKMQMSQKGPEDFWSIEYGAANEDEAEALARSLGRDVHGPPQSTMKAFSSSQPGSRPPSPSRSQSRSVVSGSRGSTPQPSEGDISSVYADIDAESDVETPGAPSANPGSSTALDGTMYGAYTEDPMFRERSPSMADSIISHMSSVDFNTQPHDPFADDFSYVPCFTIDDARETFRDTVLGLEYLHYEGVVHRDIKPANLLWTREHRVKISDFGVSYFGRPIREGEPEDELVSESEARDFDDDLELAKTVGTPAFFAPELCYTDLDGEQPRVSEQIDVWSLGVTLYCLIFARIPFMAEDEFQMFKKIAKEEVYIPSRRLRPVDPHHAPSSTSFHKRVNSEPYRDDSVLAYEDIDDTLHDLLRKMLTKNPDKRIRLREVKRHPWVVAGIPHLIAWIDETDPSRRTAGRKIEVNEREITRAVVPLTFLERARSAVKKAVGKVIHSRSEKAEGQTRKRAGSSATSSAGDSPNVPDRPYNRDARRKSLRGDDYFATVRESDHPLSQSVTATPQGSPAGDSTSAHRQEASTLVGGDFQRSASGSAGDLNSLPDIVAAHSSSLPLTSGRNLVPLRHERTRSSSTAYLTSSPSREVRTTPTTPAPDSQNKDDPITPLRKARDMRPNDDPSRSRSVDRGLFTNQDKRAEAKVALSTAVAPGSVEPPRRRLSIYRADSDAIRDSLPSPMLFQPTAIRAYQHGQPKSDLNVHARHFGAVDIAQRCMNAHRVAGMEEPDTPPRDSKPSTPMSFARGQEQIVKRQIREKEEQTKKVELVCSHQSPSQSPGLHFRMDDEVFEKSGIPSRPDTAANITSVSTDSMVIRLGGFSQAMSPINLVNSPGQTNDMQVFRSDPSLPALLSGASSVSADAEGDFLLRPGSVDRPSLIDTTDSLTPPALVKEPITGFPMGEDEQYQTLILPRSNEIDAALLLSSKAIEDDDGSDSDEGLTMAKPKKRDVSRDVSISPPAGKAMPSMKRRDTQTSIGSTETAKKVLMQSR